MLKLRQTFLAGIKLFHLRVILMRPTIGLKFYKSLQFVNLVHKYQLFGRVVSMLYSFLFQFRSLLAHALQVSFIAVIGQLVLSFLRTEVKLSLLDGVSSLQGILMAAHRHTAVALVCVHPTINLGSALVCHLSLLWFISNLP
jgi:hypothetical protein